MKQPIQFADALTTYLEKFPHRRQLKRGMVLSLWAEVVGSSISVQCKELYFKGSTLYVHVASPMWRHEVHMQRIAIMKKLNAEVKEDIVREIIVKT